MLSLIVNPSAGGGRAGRALDGVGEALLRMGLEHHVERTRSLEHACELARAAATDGETAVAFGGDGLVGAVAGALHGRDGVLGVLPGGRGNDFARVLGIPLEPVAACEVLAAGRTTRLDLGEIGDRTFIGIASCGFDSDANRIANETRVVRGNLVYAYAALRALAAWKPARFELILDGQREHVVTGYSVGACNNKAYGGGMYAAPGAELDDGLLDVVTGSEMAKWRFVTQVLPRIFKGTHVQLRQVQVLRGREVHVRSEPAFTIYADGDPIATTPAMLRAVPGAVRVVCPA